MASRKDTVIGLPTMTKSSISSISSCNCLRKPARSVPPRAYNPLPNGAELPAALAFPPRWNRASLILIWVSQCLAMCYIFYLHFVMAQILLLGPEHVLPTKFFTAVVGPDVLFLASIPFEIYHYVHRTLAVRVYQQLQIVKVVYTGITASTPFMALFFVPEVVAWCRKYPGAQAVIFALGLIHALLLLAPFVSSLRYACGVAEEYYDDLADAIDRFLLSNKEEDDV